MISADLLAAYGRVSPDMQALQRVVDPILAGIAEARAGLYESRIKTAESIFEKLQLGRLSRPLDELEDIFGARIVLPAAPVGQSRDELETALSVRFEVDERRCDRTRKPDEFIYDDLHYILRLRDTPLLPNKSLLRWRFELQVKSFLHYGWSRAAHDLVYKGPTESWRARRVVAQTKALVEVTEAALALGVDMLPDEADLPNEAIDRRREISHTLEEWWRGDLPANRRRLAIFVEEFAGLAGLPLEQFFRQLGSPKGKELATKVSISVYQAIVILLLEAENSRLIEVLERRRDRYVMITSEMESMSEACRAVPAAIRVNLAL